MEAGWRVTRFSHKLFGILFIGSIFVKTHVQTWRGTNSIDLWFLYQFWRYKVYRQGLQWRYTVCLCEIMLEIILLFEWIYFGWISLNFVLLYCILFHWEKMTARKSQQERERQTERARERESEREQESERARGLEQIRCTSCKQNMSLGLRVSIKKSHTTDPPPKNPQNRKIITE